MRARLQWIAAVVGVVLLLAASFMLGFTVGWVQGREDIADALSTTDGAGYLVFSNSGSGGYVFGGVLAALGAVALVVAARLRRTEARTRSSSNIAS